MKIVRHNVMAMDENVYIVYDEKTNDAVIIDPGADAYRLLHHIKEKELKIRAILLTHGHADHIGALPELKAELDCPVGTHEMEASICDDASVNLSTMFGMSIEFMPDLKFKTNEIFKISDELQMKVLFTPGHTKGGCCYYVEKEGVVFSGDTLFYGSVGRTDFPSEGIKSPRGPEPGDYLSSMKRSQKNMKTLVNSIKTQLFTLPDETVVYPGHG
ncbi:MAG: MBL fold metallo-hydrolase, partial [Firmicutes bacterium]|nr:MBL fold metallo-hydrolase [Bacillota bacterium]